MSKKTCRCADCGIRLNLNPDTDAVEREALLGRSWCPTDCPPVQPACPQCGGRIVADACIVKEHKLDTDGLQGIPYYFVTNEDVAVETVRDLLAKHNYKQASLARRFGIPIRTIQNWCAGVNKPPAYLIRMMDELLTLKKG